MVLGKFGRPLATANRCGGRSYEVEEWYEMGTGQERRLVVRVSSTEPVDALDGPPLRLTVAADGSASEAWRPVSDCDVLRWENATVLDSLLDRSRRGWKPMEWNPPPSPLSEEEAMPNLGTLLPAGITSAVYDRRVPGG